MESAKPHVLVRRLASFGLTTPNAHQLSEFYQKALDFRLLGTERRSGVEFERLMGVEGGASVVTLGLGDEVVELLQFDRPGRLYPKDAASSDLCFQHFAIVVADINRSLSKAGFRRRVDRDLDRWAATIAGLFGRRHGIQIPRSRRSSAGTAGISGRSDAGALAEPLPGRLFLGIDHSAISVADDAASIAFYRGLGFRVAGALVQQRALSRSGSMP